jgi:putative SOS response-associated peptidase YedK
MRWGLVPSWADDPRIGSRLINARAETLDQKPAFRTLLARRRALLPFSGFYEWHRTGTQRVGRSQPHYFCRVDGQPLVFPGLWDTWRDAEGQPLRSCTIITTAANAVVASVHRRMPVILPESSWDEWLRPEPHGRDDLRRLLAPGARRRPHVVACRSDGQQRPG